MSNTNSNQTLNKTKLIHFFRLNANGAYVFACAMLPFQSISHLNVLTCLLTYEIIFNNNKNVNQCDVICVKFMGWIHFVQSLWCASEINEIAWTRITNKFMLKFDNFMLLYKSGNLKRASKYTGMPVNSKKQKNWFGSCQVTAWFVFDAF